MPTILLRWHIARKALISRSAAWRRSDDARHDRV
jgi:hypothetical protein